MIIALFVLLSGTGVAYWVISPDQNISTTPLVSFLESKQATDSRFEAIINPTTSTVAEDISEENVVRNYGKEILRLNTQGQGIDAPIRIPKEEVFSQMIQEEISKPIPIRTYEEKDIIVLKTSDAQSGDAYRKEIDAANTKTIGSLKTKFVTAVAQYATENNSQELTAHSLAIASYISSLLATPVPAHWKDFHLTLINLLERRLAYAKAILENNDSQLKVAAAISNIVALIDEESELYKKVPK